MAMQQNSLKNLLVPTNFSAISENALYYAAALSKQLAAELKILHAYQSISSDYAYAYDNADGEVEQQRKIKLDKLCSEIQNKFGIKCSFLFDEGLAGEVILSYVDRSSADLLLIGTESISKLDRLLFGSVRGQILNKAKCNLLMV